MILLPCPWCGPRNASEFHYVGEQRSRPDPAETSVEQWRSYLYMQANPAGWVKETWFHRAGCRQYLSVERHTISNEVRGTRRPGARIRRKEAEDAPGGDIPTAPGGTTP